MTAKQTGSGHLFSRDATGLVRSFGTLDVFLMASSLIFALIFAQLTMITTYGFAQGAYLPLDLVIALGPFALIMAVYWVVGVVMPRAGSDYVWIGRTLHPSLAFATSVLYMFGVLGTAYSGAMPEVGSTIGSYLAFLGYTQNNSTLTAWGAFLSSPSGGFAVTIIITVIFATLAIAWTKRIGRFIRISWIITAFGLLLMWYILSTANPTTFQTKWDSILSKDVTYNGLLALATKSGWSVPTVTLGATLLALPIALILPLGGNFFVSLAGEVRNVKRAVPIGLFLSLVLSVVIWTITSVLTVGATGNNFIYGTGYLWDTNSAAYYAHVPFPPSQTLILSVLVYPNQILLFLIPFTFVAGSMVSLFLYFWAASRYFFAWSFDRVVPAKISDVNSRYGSPHYAIIATSIVAVAVGALINFTTFSAVFEMATFLQVLFYLFPSLGLLIFPFVKKDLVNLAPDFMRRRFGLTVMSWIGLATSIVILTLAFLFITNPAITVVTTLAEEVIPGILIGSFVLYFVSVAYHKRKGSDIRLAFKEIPPE